MFEGREKKMKKYWGEITAQEREYESLWYQYQTHLNTKKIAFAINVIGIILLFVIAIAIFQSLL